MTAGHCRTHGPALPPLLLHAAPQNTPLPPFLPSYSLPQSQKGQQAATLGLTLLLGGRSRMGQTGCREVSCLEGQKQFQSP